MLLKQCNFFALKLFFTLFLLNSWNPAKGQSESDYYQAPFDVQLQSKSLNANRSITVILPKSFNPKRSAKYPVIVVYDRQNKRIFRQLFEEINYLVTFDEIPEAIILGVTTENNENRYYETSLPVSTSKAKGVAFDQFIFDELFPYAEANYNASNVRVLIGHSRFGYFSTYQLTQHLSQLSGVISLSPFYKQPNVNLVDSLQLHLSATSLKHPVYYHFVTGDSLTDTRDYDLMKAAETTLKSFTNFNPRGNSFYQARHMAIPGLGTMPALVDIFQTWNVEMLTLLQDTLPFTKEKYTAFKVKMKEAYGDSIGLGLAILNGIGYKFYNENRFNDAINAWKLLIEDYPQFAEAYSAVAELYLEQKKMEAASFYLNAAEEALLKSNFYPQEEKLKLKEELKQLRKRLK